MEAEKGVEDRGLWQETIINAFKLRSVKKSFDLDTPVIPAL